MLKIRWFTNWLEWEITDFCKQQIDDSGFIMCVFETGFEDVLKDIQS